MKYLSKEELEDIANELLNNPTRETLKVLSNKYNGEEKVVEIPVSNDTTLEMNNVPHFNIPTFEVPSVNNEVKVSESSSIPVLEVPTFEETTPGKVEEPMINTDIPSVNVSDSIPTLEVPEMPKADNNTLVNFSGNLWEPQMPSAVNMMETTDNFNTTVNTMSQNTMPGVNQNMEVPFFGETTPVVNNQIPVSGPVPPQGVNNQMPSGPAPQGPSMFGQIQQNYNIGA